MTQLDIFTPQKAARSTDPDTSHVAAQAARRFANTHAGVILACLHRIGDGTQTDIALHTSLTNVQVNRRLHELKKADQIVETGETRLGHAGRPERVWTVADRGDG